MDMMEDTRENPAAQATGKKLSDLFAADPMNLSADDRMQIIKEMRQQRTEFIEKESKPKKPTKGQEAKKAAQDLSLDIGDISL